MLQLREPYSYARLISALGDDLAADAPVPAVVAPDTTRITIATLILAIAGTAAAYSAVSSFRRSGSWGQSLAWGAGGALFPAPSALATAILNSKRR